MNRSAEPLAPLIILCAPRSFSSVVCAMLGRHRALYGFPQLNLFLAATVAELLALDEAGPSSPAIHCAGILRTIAQLEFEEQSPEALVKARDWLNSRSAWHCRALFDYLLTRIAPCRGIDKSPSTGATRQNLLRLRRAYPKAFILHLTRDPRSTLRSLVAHYVNHSPDLQLSLTAPPAWLVNHYANLWSTSQRHIAEFIAETKPAQCFSIRGEDLLAHPQLELRSILTWLRLDHSVHAIEPMLHPEESPFARVVPGVWGDNDPSFLAKPTLRSTAAPLLQDFPFEDLIKHDVLAEMRRIGQNMGYT